MTTTATGRHALGPHASGRSIPRLLAGLGGGDPVDLPGHIALWGPMTVPRKGDQLVDQIEASGLLGHGGAWFPVAAKWKAVAARRLRRPVVVVNGAEGEPASEKDAVLLGRAPHLVLDGASAAAGALRAFRVVVYVQPKVAGVVGAAVAQRREWGVDPVDIEVVRAPDAFIAGQESAVVNFINGNPAAVPTFVGLQPVRDKGVAGRPTLVHNAETLAHVALVARFGPRWYRSLGTDRSPGTALLTITGRWERPTVVETAIGTPFPEVLGLAAGDRRLYAGALLGGYGGGWTSIDTLLGLDVSEASARSAGASLGAGVVVLLPERFCPLAETARVVRYMEEQGAGQCGPCVNGLAELASLLEALAFGRPGEGAVETILEVCTLVEGRGACRHPDGVARLVRSACSVFAGEVRAHCRQGPCARAGNGGFLPLPARSVGRRPDQWAPARYRDPSPSSPGRRVR